VYVYNKYFLLTYLLIVYRTCFCVDEGEEVSLVYARLEVRTIALSRDDE